MDASHGLKLIRAHRGMTAKVAIALGLHRSRPSQWDKVPAEHLVKIEAVTGIPREQLRPDLYRQAEAAADRTAA